ncbi:MAG: ATP-grasp domain-containing protein [Planctomycetes bacterium]|nr:ATP-grasp domain-containing protein [Planctomycetota bacterium]
MPQPYRVAVTGLNAADNPAPGIPVARSLRAEPSWAGRIVGLGYDAFDTGIYDADILDAVYLIPYPTAGEGNLLARLQYVAERTGIQALVPTLDAELENFAALEPELREAGVRMLIPSGSHLRMRSKAALADFCRGHGFRFPDTELCMDPGQVHAAAGRLGMPLVVKGIFYDAYVASTLEEAAVFFQRVRARWGLPVILQRWIDGEEYDVVALGNRDGRLVGAVAMRKLRLTEKGKAWAGVTMRDPALLELAGRIVEALRWTGPLELEFLRASHSKEYSLIEINPRFPSWVYLAARADQNLPLAAVRLALDEDVPPLPPYRTGVTFVRHAVDVVCPMEHLESLTTTGELIFQAAAEKKGT